MSDSKAKNRVGGLRKSGYHHGNLKEALVSAARVLILEKGPHGFSLIEAARLAGVSPAAPYRHFKDREALLAEVARRGYAKFSDSLERAWGGGEPDRLTAFRRLGHAYLDFALSERGLLRRDVRSRTAPGWRPGISRRGRTAPTVRSRR